MSRTDLDKLMWLLNRASNAVALIRLADDDPNAYMVRQIQENLSAAYVIADRAMEQMDIVRAELEEQVRLEESRA